MFDRRHVILSVAALGLLPAAARAMSTEAPAPALAAVPAVPPPSAKPADSPLQVEQIGSAEYPLPGLTIAPELYPVEVTVKRDFEAGSIIILTSRRFLYFITRPGHAIRYGVAVGKEGLAFRGVAQVGQMTEWPKWKPTPEMVERNPTAYAKYADDGMEGGPKNPLGARAMYLYQDGHDTAVRIHGTIEPNSIGKSVSNGCFRMVNAHVIDLYARVRLGAPVAVY